MAGEDFPAPSEGFVLTHFIVAEDANIMGTVHGGTVMKLVDTAAGLDNVIALAPPLSLTDDDVDDIVAKGLAADGWPVELATWLPHPRTLHQAQVSKSVSAAVAELEATLAALP